MSSIPTLGVNVQSVTELFHRLNSVLPMDQQVVSVSPDMLAVDALKQMQEHRFSQLPIVIGREVLGLFSYRSFANAVIKLSQKNQKFNPLELFVEDCLEKANFARVTDEFVQWFDIIDQYDAVLVGEPNRLQGVVTTMDILRYLYGVASPFVMIAEIELALRAIIRLAVNPETLSECAKDCLKNKYGDEPPTRLEDMTFSDYVQIIGHGHSWEYFQKFMGGNRNRTSTMLKQLGELRNVVFHFKRGVTVEEYETLAAGREWMLLKARVAEARQEEAKQ